MEATAQVPAGAAAPGRGHVLFSGPETRVVRVPAPGRGHVVRKERTGRDARARIEHERGILRRLDGVEGVVQLADDSREPGVLVLQDRPGISLAAFLESGPMPARDVVRLAPDLAATLAAVHRRGVVHKDVNPANLVLGEDADRIHLIDFDLATTFSAERPAVTHPSEIAGTLAYMAPEQTGRTGRMLDQRADLYGLGATLYALLVGRPPFGDDDPLQVVHDHLARVPVPPARLDPTVPGALSQVVMRLLAKEPDDRYQSAEGLEHDLRRLQAALRRGEEPRFALGERDFPARLAPPSRLVGREADRAVLEEVFADVVGGARRAVLVSGAPGVGKSALLDELRPLVTRAGGLFATGRFDQYDRTSDAVLQAVRGLGRLLLAEPEEEVAGLRERLRTRLGPNAGLAAAALPEFGVLLGVPADASEGDPLLLAARLQQVVLDVLRAVASPGRPVVLVVDDLQRATSRPLDVLDAVQLDGELGSVLLLGSYRSAEVDGTHPLTALTARWERLGVAARRLHLANLERAALGTMLAEMLKLPAQGAADLASCIGELTGGNPFDTVELVNALRRDGALALGPDGWRWDRATVRRYLERGDVVELLADRVAGLDPRAVALLDTMSCLGGEVPLERLAVAAGLPAADVVDALRPALEEGLLVTDPAGDLVLFRHDRVQQAAMARLNPVRRKQLLLRIARRLADVPAQRVFAAEPYLQVLEALHDDAERCRVAELLRAAAASTRLVAGYALTERYAAAATALLTGGDGAVDPRRRAVLVELATERHAALYSLGRLEEADEVYRWIHAAAQDPLERAEPTWAQISSLTNRNQPQAAVALALELLADLGVAVPAPEAYRADIGAVLAELHGWATTSDPARDASAPEADDPRTTAVARTIQRSIPPAFFSDPTVMTWLISVAGRMWTGQGVAAPLVGPLAHVPFVTAAMGGDHRTGNVIARRVLAVAEARGYGLDAAQPRFTFALSSSAWFAPVEESVAHAHRAHEELVRAGDLYFAGGTFYASLPGLLDCAAGVEELEAEADAAVAFCRRTGNAQAGDTFVALRQLARCLRGATSAPGSLADEGFDEAAHVAGLAANPVAASWYAVAGGVVAALSGDGDALVRNAAAVAPLMPLLLSTHLSSTANLLQALALAHRARTAAPAERDGLVAELDVHRTWFAQRAADQPGNFAHLLHLLQAERAWALGDFRAAATAFDLGHRCVAGRPRAWHRALLLERAARFHRDAGLDWTAQLLLDQAAACYEDWGATARAAELERTRGAAGPARHRPAVQQATARSTGPGRTTTLRAADLDLLGILRATQALGSETDLDRLRGTVTAVVSALSGASGVTLALWSEEAEDWFLPASAADGAEEIPLARAGEDGLVPVSAFRYAERTREPLVVDDATRDDRFAQDPYVAGLERCSLLLVPILTRGRLRAMLVLENSTSTAVFSADRLDAVLIIAGQLAASLDNAMLGESLERRVAQRVQHLDEANERLVRLSNTDPLTGLANRRHMTEVLEREWREAAAAGRSIAVAMVDIDFFKKYNDHYGHQSGDGCLAAVAGAVGGCGREGDLVARYGGEEFMVVLPGADVAAAHAVGAAACERVRALALPHEASPHGVVTLSVGVAAAVPTASSTPQDLVEAADRQLYVAKREGRARVVSGAQV